MIGIDNVDKIKLNGIECGRCNESNIVVKMIQQSESSISIASFRCAHCGHELSASVKIHYKFQAVPMVTLEINSLDFIEDEKNE